MSCNYNPCNTCCQPKKPCGCFHPILDIDEMPDSVSILRFNVDGLSSWYDFGNMIFQTQTDTVLKTDILGRVLKYMAERHVDTISARELGAILHISDIGDVDITGVEDNSLFVYQKDNNCASGCEGIDNSWTAWNSNDHMVDSVKTLMGFNDAGAPLSLAAPANADQYYILGWNADKQVSYKQIEEVSKESITTTEGSKSYIYKVCVDPKTNELVYIKEEVS